MARRIELVLWIFGFIALAIPAISMVQARRYQRQQTAILDQAIAHAAPRVAQPIDPGPAMQTSTQVPAAPAAGQAVESSVECPVESEESPPASVAPPSVQLDPSNVIGRLEIPRLGLSTMVREGVDATTLKLAVGHIPETPFPWQPGNVGLAGHRDTFFKSLEGIKKNDLIRMTTLKGITTYRVESLRIVTPEEVSVLDPSAEPVLTLVTCYPFIYVGSAPRRFIVRARGVTPLPAPRVAVARARRPV